MVVGAVAAIAVDLQDVKKSLEDDTDPALSPILDLNEANILELWDHLAEQGESRLFGFQWREITILFSSGVQSKLYQYLVFLIDD